MKRRGPDGLARCTKIAGNRYGVLTIRQAEAAGLSREAVWKLARAHHWKRLRPEVYALWVPTAGRELWRHRLTGAALWLGDRSAVSHRAAAVDWELDGVDAAPFEFVTTGRKRSAEAGLVIHRVRWLRAEDVVRRSGLRVTSVARTLIDLCAVVPRLTVELALECALRKRLTSATELAAALAGTASTAKGRGVMGALLARFPGTSTDSTLEALAWSIFVEADLPLPIRQYVVRDSRGRIVARVDFAYPEIRLAIEADSHRFHSGRRDWTRDLRRQNEMVGLRWTTYRVTWEDATRRRRQVAADIACMLPAKHDPATRPDGNSRVDLSARARLRR